MPTFTQALLLGTERLSVPPAPPHPLLAAAWAQLDWAGAKESALLDAAALVATTRSAGTCATASIPALEPAPAETRAVVSSRAVAVLRRLLPEECRALLPEWLELCAARGLIVSPFYLRSLFNLATDDTLRALVRQVAGERGRWLARQNPEWVWLTSGDAAQPLDAATWETGTTDERVIWFTQLRAKAPDEARTQLEKTWAEEIPDFRETILEAMRPGLSVADEPFLTRLLKDRRKGVRTGAQALLATLPASAFAGRQRARAEALLTLHRGFLSKKLEITLPAEFDAAWAADGLEEKPPAGVGAKAFWAQQILALVPLDHWVKKFDLEPDKLIELAGKSSDWADLLFAAWYRSAQLHRDADAAAVLIRPILARQKPVTPGVAPLAAATSLLALCSDAKKWQLATEIADFTWPALPLLLGQPRPHEARALLAHLTASLRDGYNPGGSPAAVLAARRVSPELHAEAARLLARDNGLSKPAEAFLHALELRANLHAAFTQPPSAHV